MPGELLCTFHSRTRSSWPPVATRPSGAGAALRDRDYQALVA